MATGIRFTDSAAKKVWELILEEENRNLKLRVYIEGGGCSGFQYVFTFDEEKQDDDFCIEKQVPWEGKNETVQLLIDASSYQYLAGAEIDYEEAIQGAQFIIRNPQAKTTCGCGSSFSV